jgi:hypothetical protein
MLRRGRALCTCAILSEEGAAATDEWKERYSYHELDSAIGMLRLAFAKPGEHSLSMTPQ